MARVHDYMLLLLSWDASTVLGCQVLSRDAEVLCLGMQVSGWAADGGCSGVLVSEWKGRE